MNPVRATRNQYIGINAHLHSLLQSGLGWQEFHTSHIVHLTSALKLQLRPLGYTASVEESLQIRRYGEPQRNPKSDVLIYDEDPIRPYRPIYPSVGSTQDVVMPLPIMLDLAEEEMEHHRAIGIYPITNPREDQGEPVAWIELLSPSNKPGGQDARYYRDKRKNILQAGLVFVEIDYLHESLSTFKNVVPYKNGEQALAHPYRIGIIDPRPDIYAGEGRLREFDVDTSIPVMDIPLNGGDVLRFDFGQPYHKTFDEMLYGEKVDYSQLPLNFNAYKESDQARIVSRMLAVLDTAQAGRDLEQPPQPIETLPLDEALKRLEIYQSA